ncbi:unnamed protein product [Phaeothamnion confervicola]
MMCVTATEAFSQSSRKLIGFERNHPEILAFRQKFPDGESSFAGTKVPALALPVLDFTYPAVAGLGGFASAAPSIREFPVFDPRDPTTYTVHHRYGDVDITISGDLNIQGTPDGAGPGGTPSDIVVEAASPEEEPVARVTAYKFRIPYVIDIVCGPAHAQLCRDETRLRTLAERLALVSVPKR